MKSFIAAGSTIALLASLIAAASKPDAPAARADEELERVRDAHARLIQSIGARLDRLDRHCARSAESDRMAGERLEAVARRIEALGGDVLGADGMLRGLRDSVAELRKERTRDARLLQQAILLPSVQVSARGGVGGGTLIRSVEEPGGGHATYVLTAFHVVQKSIERDEQGKERRTPSVVRFYGEDGGAADTVEADVVLSDDRRDLALLKLRSTRAFPFAARLAARERVRELSVFTPICAVGCPLGHDPLPSFGEITTRRKEVNGETFWMMSAPTIFGNSGGGVFHRESMEMIGVSAMICTFDNPVTTPVPHLGILVPLDAVYDWLRANRFEFLVDAAPASARKSTNE